MPTETAPILGLPEPGYYPDVDEATYRAWPAASQSILKILATKSPRHAKYRMDNPTEPTDAMKFGTAVHMATLQPERFREHYVVAGQCSATVKSTGQACTNAGVGRFDGQWLCGVHCKRAGEPEQLNAIDEATMTRIAACAAALTNHPRGGRFFGSLDYRELPIVWRDEESGLDCKALVDGVGELRGPQGQSRAFAIDIKTCQDAELASFEKSIFTGGYFMQAAHYMHGLAAVGLPVEDFIFAAVESSAPHGVKIYRMTDDVIRTGWQLLAGDEFTDGGGAYHRMAECIKNDRWPGYGIEVEEIGLPTWAFRQLFRADH